MSPRKRPSTEEIVQELKERRSQEVIEVDEKTQQFVVVSVGEDWFGFPGSQIREILSHSPVTAVPGVPPIFLGVINVRGDLESVIDLARVLGLERHANPRQERILIGHAAGLSSGILVDTVFDIIDVPMSRISDSVKIADRQKAHYFTGEFEFRSRPVVVIDAGHLFTDLLRPA